MATKWIYNVPILPDVKIFEMPILGFGGFPPFAVECFAMYVTGPAAFVACHFATHRHLVTIGNTSRRPLTWLYEVASALE